MSVTIALCPECDGRIEADDNAMDRGTVACATCGRDVRFESWLVELQPAVAGERPPAACRRTRHGRTLVHVAPDGTRRARALLVVGLLGLPGIPLFFTLMMAAAAWMHATGAPPSWWPGPADDVPPPLPVVIAVSVCSLVVLGVLVRPVATALRLLLGRTVLVLDGRRATLRRSIGPIGRAHAIDLDALETIELIDRSTATGRAVTRLVLHGSRTAPVTITGPRDALEWIGGSLLAARTGRG